MKLRPFVLGTLVVAIIAIAVGWHLRNGLIQRLSAPLLDEYGMSISDVSLDALATRDATISYLELTHESGTIIAIRDLTLPFLADEAGVRSYRAAEVSIRTSKRDEDVPFEMAAWIERTLALPQLLAGSDVVIERLQMPHYRPVSDIHWVLGGDTQALSATVDQLPLSIAISQTSALEHQLFLSTAAASIGAGLEMGDAGISIGGAQAVRLADWMPLASLVGIVPERVRIDAGDADAAFAVNIPFDTGTTPDVTATAVPTSPWSVRYGDGSDDVAVLVAASNNAVTIHATFPEVSWDADSNQARLTVSAGDWRQIPVALTDAHCESGIRCTAAAAVSMSAAALPVGAVGAVEGSSTLKIFVGEQETRVGFEPGARLHVEELSGDAAVIGALEAQFVSAVMLTATEDGWSLAAGSVDGRVERLGLSDDSTASAAVFLENLAAGNAGDRLVMSAGVYAPSSEVAVPGMSISTPGFRGRVSLEGSAIAASLETVGLNDNAAIRAAHDTASGIGRLSLDGAGISFGKRTLAQRFAPWPYPWGVSGGTMGLSLEADWRLADARLAATANVKLSEIAGFYDEVAFTGLATAVDASYASVTGFTVAPAELSVALVDVGLPLENITARYRLDANALAVDVDALRMEAFGGVIRADPFSFRTAAERNNLVLNAESVDLTELLSMQDFEAINIAGRVSAVLPVAIIGDRIVIEGGTLTGDAPGGRIRYAAGADSEPAAGGGLALATKALSNFEFDTLSSAVDYGEQGDLKLQMKLTGRNPDMDSQRPVVLNLGLETNIPQMLKSLQAARSVEQVLQQRVEQ
jgi:hypothetical protein